MPHRLPSYFLPFILVALSFHALGCGETRNAGPITEVELNAIFVSPPNTTADLNSDIQFVASGVYSDGTTKTLDQVMWQSGDIGILEIDSMGLATTFALGEVKVIAVDTQTGRKGETTLRVVESTPSPDSLLQIEIISEGSTLRVGEELSLSVRGHFTDGHTETMENISWLSSQEDTATVAISGMVRGQAIGNVVITAVEPISNLSTTISLSVLPTTGPVTDPELASLIIHPANSTLGINEELALTAVAIFTDGSSETLTSGVHWTSSDNSVATVSANGSVLGISEGTIRITANHYASGLEAYRELTIELQTIIPELTSITVSSPAPTVTGGQLMQLVATGHLSNDTTIDLTNQVQWSSTAEDVATVDEAGLVTAIDPGLVTIQAESGDLEGALALTVISEDTDTSGESSSEGTIEAPLVVDAPSTSAPQGNYVNSGEKSYYQFSITPGTFYSIQLTDLTGDADLYNYDDNANFTMPVCMSARWGTENELCEFQRARGDTVYFMVDGTFSVDGARYTISIRLYEATLLGSAPQTFNLNVGVEKKLFAIPAEMGRAFDVAIKNMSADVDLYVHQAPFYCAGVTIGLSNETCPNQIPFDGHFYVFVDGSYSGAGAQFDLVLTTAEFEEQTLALAAAPFVHFGEVTTGVSIYSVNVSPGRRYDIWLTNMTDNVDLWVYGSDSTFQQVDCSSATDNALEKCEGMVAGTDKIYLAVDGSRTVAGSAYAFFVALAP